jgi:hypothetical protein
MSNLRLSANTLKRPRLTRIVVVWVVALGFVAVMFPVIDEVYLRFLYRLDAPMIPALITAAFGCAVYLAGWLLLVGGTKQPEPRVLSEVYLWGGVVSLGLAIVLILSGLYLVQ